MHDLGIVIVNYNTRNYLRRCLQTVFASQGDFTYRVVVVDNASSDDSVAMVRTEFPQVEVIASETNGGFSYANNLGLRLLGYRDAGDVDANAPRYALLLNPDTEVLPESLNGIVRFMDSQPTVGVAGPKLVLEDGSLDLACRRSFPTPMVSFYRYSGLSKLFPRSPVFGRYNMTHIDPDVELEVDSVVGAYMQVRKEAIKAAGLLDERFFMYGEDLDWAFRIKKAGWKVFYHPAVTVRHVKRAASRRSRKAQFEFHRASLMFYRKHYRATTPLPLHLMVLTGLLLKGGRDLLPELRRASHSTG
jgi:GT2 family glycosyltransferase